MISDNDCEWYLSNLVDSSEIDITQNRTLCEAFFGADVRNSTENGILNITEATTLPFEYDLTMAIEEDLETAATESFLANVISATTDATSYEDNAYEDFGTTTTFESLLEDDNFNVVQEAPMLNEASTNHTFEKYIADTLFGTDYPEATTIADSIYTTLSSEEMDTTLQTGIIGTTLGSDAIGTTLGADTFATTLGPDAFGTTSWAEAIDTTLRADAIGTTSWGDTIDTTLRSDAIGTTSWAEAIDTTLGVDEISTTSWVDAIGTTLDAESIGTTLGADAIGTTLGAESFGTTVAGEAIGTTFGSTYGADAIQTVTSTLHATLNTTVASVERQFSSIETTVKQLEEFIFVDDSVVNEAHNMSVNNTLCEWYLPTVNQVPKALGIVGIALWVLGFVITIILICMFIKQFHFIYTTAHKSFRRHLYSINSIYVTMALMTSIGSGVPRAHAVCSAAKDIFMSIGIGHFVDLTIAMYGGENVMAWYLKERTINLRVIPLFKCFCCIPRCKTTKLSINVLKWLVWQMKWSQALYYLIKLIWRKSLENSIGIVPHFSTSPFLYVHLLNVASFLSGVFSLLIIGSLVTDDLQLKYNYTIKAKTVRFTIITTKMQRLIFEILETFNVFPCYTPYVSSRFYKNVLKDFIYLVEVLILGTITFFVYTRRGEFENGNPKETPDKVLEKEHELEENGFVDEEMTTPLQKQNSNNFPAESAC